MGQSSIPLLVVCSHPWPVIGLAKTSLSSDWLSWPYCPDVYWHTSYLYKHLQRVPALHTETQETKVASSESTLSVVCIVRSCR